MNTILHVVGNRPQFIKLAVLHRAIAEHTTCRQRILHTGQHSSQQMSDIFFTQLSIPSPDIQLQTEAHTADEFIGKTATALTGIFLQHPAATACVLVYGDTNTTLAAALAARRCGLPLLHFEAGVRTADTAMPEEINRILTDRLAQVHYCCTQKNADTLRAEGFGSVIPADVRHSGDLMLDAFMHIATADKNITNTTDYIACTIHRAANITNRLRLQQIVNALNEIHKQTEVIVPLHPHTQKRLQQFDIVTHFTVTEPLGYAHMKRFLLDAAYVITDSGGASREAYFAGKKSLIIMEHPFWYEIVEAGAALHCDANTEAILTSFQQLHLLQPRLGGALFGNGNAAQYIARHLASLA